MRDPIFCEMLVVIGAAYHLAPIVIVFPFFPAFKMPFAIQLQYLIYRWNVLLITALTGPPKIHLHLFLCQLGFIMHAASALGSRRDFFFHQYKVTFSSAPAKAPKIHGACTKSLQMHIFGPGKGFFVCDTSLQKRNGFLQRSGLLENATKEGCNSWK